jgi:ABC-2 type transport system ATP-binding protein
MEGVILESVSKTFRHRPALFNWLGREQRGETRALTSVSLTVSAGSVLVLLGPNGSGKTTLLKLVSTMLLPDHGWISVNGADTRKQAGKVRQNVGFAVVTERSFFPRLTARENLEFFAALDDVARKCRKQQVETILQQVGLSHAADRLVMKFSSGMWQRLGIARALLKNPSVILLDEPTRSLDPGSATQFFDLVRTLAAQGAAVILATHSFQEALAVGDFVAVLDHGRLSAFRSLSALQQEEKLRSFYFESTGDFEESAQLVSRSA